MSKAELPILKQHLVYPDRILNEQGHLVAEVMTAEQARQIVLCVNSHGRLVEQLKAMLAVFAPMAGINEHRAVVTAARAAIADAEGEGK